MQVFAAFYLKKAVKDSKILDIPPKACDSHTFFDALQGFML